MSIVKYREFHYVAVLETYGQPPLPFSGLFPLALLIIWNNAFFSSATPSLFSKEARAQKGN